MLVIGGVYLYFFRSWKGTISSPPWAPVNMSRCLRSSAKPSLPQTLLCTLETGNSWKRCTRLDRSTLIINHIGKNIFSKFRSPGSAIWNTFIFKNRNAMWHKLILDRRNVKTSICFSVVLCALYIYFRYFIIQQNCWQFVVRMIKAIWIGIWIGHQEWVLLKGSCFPSSLSLKFWVLCLVRGLIDSENGFILQNPSPN